jgi:hypothetical protein
VGAGQRPRSRPAAPRRPRRLFDVALDPQKRDCNPIPDYGHLTHDSDLPSGALHDRGTEGMSVIDGSLQGHTNR